MCDTLLFHDCNYIYGQVLSYFYVYFGCLPVYYYFYLRWRKENDNLIPDLNLLICIITTPNQHIRLISEEIYDTKDWSIDVENPAVPSFYNRVYK